jgi:hypothetical protein
MVLNAYLICLRFKKGSTIKRTVQVGRSNIGTIQSGGAVSDERIPFPLMTKGETFIICKDRIAWRKSTEAGFQREHE